MLHGYKKLNRLANVEILQPLGQLLPLVGLQLDKPDGGPKFALERFEWSFDAEDKPLRDSLCRIGRNVRDELVKMPTQHLLAVHGDGN